MNNLTKAKTIITDEPGKKNLMQDLGSINMDGVKTNFLNIKNNTKNKLHTI